MRLFKHKTPDAPPCKHMVGMLNGTADGSLRGLRRFYALAHAAHCEPCRRFLAALRGMIGSLKASKNEDPPPDVLVRLRERVKSAGEGEL